MGVCSYSPKRRKHRVENEILPDYAKSNENAKINLFNVINSESKNNYEPHVKPGMPDTKVKRHIGFKSEQNMIAYILLLRNGDLE